MKNKFLLLSLFLLLATAFNAQSYTTGVVNITTTSGLAMSVKIDISTNVTLTLTGPSGRWFALGFNANSMTNGTDVVGVHSATTLNAFDAKLTGFGAPVTDSQQDWTITSDVVNAGVRTIIATRALNTFDPNDYTFSATPTTLGLIWARSASASFTYSNHGSTNRGTALVSFTYVPPPAPPAAPTGSANQTFCSGATLAQLSATGTAVQWYATPTGGSALPSNTVLVNGTTYYATQTVNGLESTSRLAVTVTVNTAPAAPGSISGPVHFCYNSTGQSFSIGAVSGATSYVWTTPAGSTGSSTSTSINLLFTPGFQSGSLSVKAQNTCGQSPNTSIVIHQHLASATNLSVTTCGSYNFNSQNITQSGVYTYQGTTIWGCDSVVVLNLTINNIINVNLTESACELYTWNGQDLTNSGTYTDTLQAVNGCDSVVVLNLTIHQNAQSIESSETCGSFPWNGQTYYNSGLFTDTLQTIYGCDSIVSLDLTIHPISAQTFDTTVLDLFSWNGIDYASSGTYTQNFLSAFGCDSTVTYNVTIQDSGLETLDANAVLYPNPVRGDGNICIENLYEMSRYDIYSIVGVLVQSGYTNNGTVQLEDFPIGNYYIELDSKRYLFVVQ